MKKSHCLFSNLKNKFLFALTVIAMAFAFTGCPNPTVPGSQGAVIIPGESISTFVGTWENNDYGWHSEYQITSSAVNDVSSSCSYNIVSSSTVKSSDGYTLIFCQCSQGNEYIPTERFYAVAVKLDTSGNLDIYCPIGDISGYDTLEDMCEVCTSSYAVSAHNNNYPPTTCTSTNWTETITCSGSANNCVIVKNNGVITVTLGSESFVVTYANKVNDTEVSMPSSNGTRMTTEVDKCLTLADNSTLSLREYELFITYVEYMGWTYGLYDTYEDEDSGELVTAALAQGILTEQQANLILRHFL